MPHAQTDPPPAPLRAPGKPSLPKPGIHGPVARPGSETRATESFVFWFLIAKPNTPPSTLHGISEICSQNTTLPLARISAGIKCFNYHENTEIKVQTRQQFRVFPLLKAGAVRSVLRHSVNCNTTLSAFCFFSC